MLRLPAALILLFVAPPAFAQAFYRWVDAQGTTHYTDNPGSIPQGATVYATQGEPISQMGKPAPVPAPAPVVAAPAAAPAVAQKQVDLDPAIPSSSEQFWRGQFRAAKDKIRILEDEIAADRHRTEDVNGMPASITYSCAPGFGYVGVAPPVRTGSSIVVGPKGAQAYFGPVPQGGYVNSYNTCIQTINPEYDRARHRLEKNRGALVRAQEELQDLERRASFEAVPLEWRR